MNKPVEYNEPILLKCKKEDICCQFIIGSEFTDGVIASGNYHFHSLYEIHIPVSGKLHILAEDVDVICNPGEVCIIPPDKTHYVFPDSNSYRTGFRFAFSGSENIFNKTYCGLDGVTVLKNCDIYNKYILLAIENYKNNMPDFMMADLLFHSLYEIALKLDKRGADKRKTENTFSDILIAEKIEIFLNMNYNCKIKLDDLARHLNLGKRQTERVTNKLFGMTFSPLLSRKRLATAKFLLKTTDMSISEISVVSGFEDKNYFYRKFSAAFGTTPGKYREKREAT